MELLIFGEKYYSWYLRVRIYEFLFQKCLIKIYLFGYSLEQAQVVGIVGIVGMVGIVGIVGINK